MENIKDKVKRIFRHVKRSRNCNQNKQAIETGLQITRMLLIADKHTTGIKICQRFKEKYRKQ